MSERVGNDYYIFLVEEKKPGRMNYEEVKEWVRNDYMNTKLAAAYQHLIAQLPLSSEVKLLPQVITGEGSVRP